MKKYKEFFEKKYILLLDQSDLYADYEFHKIININFNDNELYEVEAGAPENYNKIKENGDDYIRKMLNDNIIHYDKFEFIFNSNCGRYQARFYGKKSDLENINKYFGVIDDKNIHEETL